METLGIRLKNLRKQKNLLNKHWLILLVYLKLLLSTGKRRKRAEA